MYIGKCKNYIRKYRKQHTVPVLAKGVTQKAQNIKGAKVKLGEGAKIRRKRKSYLNRQFKRRKTLTSRRQEGHMEAYEEILVFYEA